MVVTGLLYGMVYPYHLHYSEHLQMFLLTGEYFRETVAEPGGLADWAGRFLTQFFGITWAGATIMALLFGGVYAAAWSVVGRGKQGHQRLFWALVLLLPMRFLGEYGCYEDAMPASWIALIVSLLPVTPLRRLRHDCGRRLLTFVLTIVLYWAVGPLAFLFTTLMLIHELFRKDTLRWVWIIGIALTVLVLPQVAHIWVNWPFSILWGGIHYFRFPYVHLPFLWEAAIAIALIDLLTRILRKPLQKLEGINVWALGLGTFALMVLVIGNGVRREYRPNTEVVMMYDDMVINERWEDILHEAALRTPKYPACLQCINLAMAKTGTMGDLLFRCPQSDVTCLMPNTELNFARPFTAGMIYLNVGWTNTAQRMFFEAQESISDYQKSALCHKMLAMTHIIRGEKALARKYLLPLTHTLFYKQWAKETLALIDNPDPAVLSQHPFYGMMRRGAVREDYFFSPDKLAMIGNYCTTTPHNPVATQYLLALALVEKKLDTFAECLNLQNYFDGKQQMGKYYQEALLLRAHLTGQQVPEGIDQRAAEAYQEFEQAREGGASAAMMQPYLFSYWYYYYYVNNEKKK